MSTGAIARFYLEYWLLESYQCGVVRGGFGNKRETVGWTKNRWLVIRDRRTGTRAPGEITTEVASLQDSSAAWKANSSRFCNSADLFILY